MRIIAKYIKTLFNSKGQAEITFKVDNFRHVSALTELDDEKLYRIEIKEVKSARSINQNKFMWAMLRELSIATQEDEWAWYIKALTDTDAKHEYVWGLEKAEDSLRKGFRAVQKIKPHKIGDSDGWLYKCYLGSSQFKKDEMTRLIDVIMGYCHEHNINTDSHLYE